MFYEEIKISMFFEEKRIKQGLSYISFFPLRILYNNSHYNGNISGNKCCRCNEGSLYYLSRIKMTEEWYYNERVYAMKSHTVIS